MNSSNQRVVGRPDFKCNVEVGFHFLKPAQEHQE